MSGNYYIFFLKFDSEFNNVKSLPFTLNTTLAFLNTSRKKIETDTEVTPNVNHDIF